MAKNEFVRYAYVIRCSATCNVKLMKRHRIVDNVYSCSCLQLWLFTLVAVNGCGSSPL
jgi:hypothetical protein